MGISKIGPEEYDIKIKFGGGLNTRSPEDEIDEREASDGVNFNLEAKTNTLRARGPFDLVGTAPNAEAILGGGSFLDANGATKMFIQAGDTVYEWDGQNFDASPILDTVNQSAQLRGHWRSHYWSLSDKLLVTDLSLNEVVKEWDGTTWQDVTFTNEDDSGFGNFFAKYLSVSNERAVFSNIKDVSATPHMIVGSERGDYTGITVNNRPSSSLSAADPFFLLTPDLRAVNGHVEAFGVTVLSTEFGRIFNLTGEDATDFAFDNFYAGSAAVGEESIAYIGNDIIYGRPGRIESVKDTDRFGDTEADDLTLPVADEVKDYTGWTTIYNSRLNRVYLFPASTSEVWVFDTALRGSNVSPWMRWTTTHALAFQPSFVMSMLDPLDGLEYVFMGDTDGNLYRLEGTGLNGDGGTDTIRTEWLTRLYSAPVDGEISQIEGYVKYRRKGTSVDLALQFEFSGERVFDESIVVTLPATISNAFYNADFYYNDDNYYGATFRERLSRKLIWVPGGSNEMQVRIVAASNADFDLNEIGLRFVVNS